MKRLITVLLAVAITAIAVAPAQAHWGFYDVRINGSPWSNTFVSGPSFQLVGCNEMVVVGPGETKYYAKAAGADYAWGLAVAIDWTHWHGSVIDGDWTTGAETRQFVSSTYNSILATRRVKIDPGGGLPYKNAVKFVHQQGANTFVIRGNCGY